MVHCHLLSRAVHSPVALCRAPVFMVSPGLLETLTGKNEIQRSGAVLKNDIQAVLGMSKTFLILPLQIILLFFF